MFVLRMCSATIFSILLLNCFLFGQDLQTLINNLASAPEGTVLTLEPGTYTRGNSVLELKSGGTKKTICGAGNLQPSFFQIHLQAILLNLIMLPI